jgi:hypothetical protein
VTGENRSAVRQTCHSATVCTANSVQGVCRLNAVCTVSSAVTPRSLVNGKVSNDSEKCAASIFRVAAVQSCEG